MAATLALQALAILIYPGLVAVAIAGLVCELALTRRRVVELSATAVAVAALAALAGAQLAAPFGLGDSGDRNLLVAVVALAAAVCLAWAAAGGVGGTLLLGGLGACTLGLLIPAVLAQDLHPEVVAAGGLLASAARDAAAVLYLLGLAAVLAPLRGSPLRLWLWLPLGGLFASVFLPPFSGDLGGAVGFYAVTAAAIAAGALLSRPAARFM